MRLRSTRRPRGSPFLVLDCRSSGGQAGASARIENYLGFPTAISGMALMARAYNQAHKFGVETTIPSEVVGFDTPDLDSRAKCNGLCEPDLHVFAKLFEGRQERGLETQAFANISAWQHSLRS